MLAVGSVPPQVGVKDALLSTIRSRNHGSLRHPSSATEDRRSQEPRLRGCSCSAPVWPGCSSHLGTGVTQATSPPSQSCPPSLFLCVGQGQSPRVTVNRAPGRLTPETFLLAISYRDICSLKWEEPTPALEVPPPSSSVSPAQYQLHVEIFLKRLF